MNEFDLVRLLAERKFHICCAESCTAGLISAAIVNVPDASAVLEQSYITYSDSAKVHLLGVNPKTIEKFGVVSCETAAEMAAGAANAAGCEASISATGYAGPSGGDSFAERGTVCLGFCIKGKTETAKVFRPELSRNELRLKAAQFAIDHMCRLLINQEK